MLPCKDISMRKQTPLSINSQAAEELEEMWGWSMKNQDQEGSAQAAAVTAGEMVQQWRESILLHLPGKWAHHSSWPWNF